MGNKYMKHAFEWILKILLYVTLGPVVVFYYCILRCSLALQIKRLQVKGCNEQGRNSTKKNKRNKLTELTELSNSEKLDFKKHRQLSYTHQITFGSLYEIANLAGGKVKVPLVSNHALHHVLFNSMLSYGLEKDDNPMSEVAWRFLFSEMGNYKHFREFQWDVAEILILKSGRLKIRDISGKIHTPRCKTWPLAKAHAQAQLTCFAPGLALNHVHIVLPSIIASEVRKILPKTSILRQLLEPHTRFTQYINSMVLNDCSTDSRKLSDRFLRPWLSQPIEDDDFIAEMQKKCEKYYNDGFTTLPKLNDEIPYQAFIKEYYSIFHKFVTDLSPLLKSDFEGLQNSISDRIPAIRKVDMINFLAEFLWNASIIHYSDRESYSQQWARKYGCMTTRIPLVKLQPEKHNVKMNTISDGKVNSAYTVDVDENRNKNTIINIEAHQYSKEDGSKFFRSIDVCRTRCFLKTYVQRNESSHVNMKLFETKYDFSDTLAMKAAENFLTDLKDLSSKFKQRGEAIVKGEQFTRSVCF